MNSRGTPTPLFSIDRNVHPTTEDVRAIPLFAELEDADLSQVSRGLICKHVRRSEFLFRQGTEADSAFFVQSGTLSVLSALPGGGEVHLSNCGAGDMLGETSLVATGVRTASVRADTDVIGFAMERWFFQRSLAYASPGTTRLLRQLIQIVGGRLCDQYKTMAAKAGAINTCASCRGNEPAPTTPNNVAPSTFSYLDYLPRLGIFSNFQPDDIRMFVSQVRGLEVPRDAVLFEKNETPVSCFFVVRGALELCVAQEDGHYPVAVLGPGSFLGTTEIISGGARAACGRVRENAVVLEISSAILLGLLSDQSCFAVKFQLAFCESLIGDLSRVNKRVTRLTSQVTTTVN